VTRRRLLGLAAAGASPSAAGPLGVPVHRVTNARAQFPSGMLRRFWSAIWPEAYRDFHRSGIRLEATDAEGAIRRSPGDRPLFDGVRRGAVNLVLTDRIPMHWDNGRALAGVSTIDGGYHLCVIALRYAHGHQVPFLSVNTCVHELLHVLLQDIFIDRPAWHRAGRHEARIDWFATRMWLFGDAAEVRRSAGDYLKRLRAG
jgi:hypothetical protein